MVQQPNDFDHQISQDWDTLNQILQDWAVGQPPTPANQQQIEAWLLADDSAKAFDVHPSNVHQVLEARSRLLQSVYPTFLDWCDRIPSFQTTPLILLWNLWLPLALQIAEHHQTIRRPLIQGILGSQGTGKTTLASALTLILNHLGCRTLSLSLDDLYKTYADRLQLQEQDPRLIWRGPPGTHDVELGLSVLKQLRRSDLKGPVQVPRFDKSAFGGAGDRIQSETIAGADVVLFEGWFVGACPVDPATFETAPYPILTEADRKFAADSNARLQNYLPLWDQLDRLIVLYPQDYRFSQEWRRQAEQQMIASGKSGMSDTEVDRFVEYFWKALHPELFIQPLVQTPQAADLVIEINRDHLPARIYRP